jgi:hypothetical protein
MVPSVFWAVETKLQMRIRAVTKTIFTEAPVPISDRMTRL